MKVHDLQFRPHPREDLEWAAWPAPNGYTASVLRRLRCERWGDYIAYEVAVVHGGRLVYDTPVTSGILTGLSIAEIDTALADIAALPPREPKP